MDLGSFAPFIYYVRLWTPKKQPWDMGGSSEIHCYRLWYVIDGTIIITHGDQEIALRPEQAAITEPGMKVHLSPHTETIYGAFDLTIREYGRKQIGERFAVMDDASAQPSWQSICGSELPIPLPDDWTLSGRSLLDHCRHFCPHGPTERRECNARLGLWIAQLMCSLNKAEGNQPLEGQKYLAHQADALIRSSYHSFECSVETIAQRLQITPGTLYQAYRKLYGYGPRAAIEKYRMERAMELLAGKDRRPVAEIARMAGYTSLTAFSRAFGRVHNVSPTRWRREKNGI